MDELLVQKACKQALALAPQDYLSDLPISSGTSAPEWYAFELEAWEIGENIRSSFVGKRITAFTEPCISAILEVIQHRNLRRGRQSFVMCFERPRLKKYAPKLIEWIDDPDIGGHVMSSLWLMKAPGFSAQVNPLLTAQHVWVRKLANQYLVRFGEAV